MEALLHGQVVVVTGGGRGIGRVYAHRLAAAGATVAIVARSAHELAETVDSIRRAGGHAFSVTADVTDVTAVADAMTEIAKALGPIDVLINNAGISGVIGYTWECDIQAWWRVIEINLGGAMAASRAVLPGMIKRRQGRLVNIVSVAGATRWPTVSAYSVSKAALIKLTENIAFECEHFGIAVFAYHPGFLPLGIAQLGLSMSNSPNQAEANVAAWCREQIASGKVTEPEYSADKLLALLSGAHDALSGRYLSVQDDFDSLAHRVETLDDHNDFLMLRVKV